MESRYFLFQPLKVQIKLAKYVLGVNKTAPHLAVLGELGMIPCSVDAKIISQFFIHSIS
jgi:hypothetical protein